MSGGFEQAAMDRMIEDGEKFFSSYLTQADDVQITTQAGDIVLYSGNNIVIFYGSNSWAYTRLGHIELSSSEMPELLSHGDVTVKLSVE